MNTLQMKLWTSSVAGLEYYIQYGLERALCDNLILVSPAHPEGNDWQHQCDGYTLIGTAELTVTSLVEDVRPEAIKGLHKQIEKVQAESEKALTVLRARIQNLLALEGPGSAA